MASPLQTMLIAELSSLVSDRRIECHVGPYGDLAVALEAAQKHDLGVVVTIIEWPDLDPRLGYRQLGGWSRDNESELLSSASARLSELEQQISDIAKLNGARVILVCPSLPLPPAFLMPHCQAGSAEWRLRVEVATFGARCASQSGVKVVSPECLEIASPIGSRHDIRSDLGSDYPYTTEHTARMASLIAGLAHPAQPLKGVITDLDDTLWRGLVGEVGTDAIAWDLDAGAQMHGVYQQFLAALSDDGVLLALASKNDPVLVADALRRQDLKISSDRFFPSEVGWHSKSQSVARILETWNVAPDSVAFIDDSAIELAEVAAQFPTIHCLRFPTGDDVAILALVRDLRAMFAKETVRPEDRLRRDSIRVLRQASAESHGIASRDAFLSALNAKLMVDFTKHPGAL